MKADIETLVELIVCRARVDKTAPDSESLRNGWRTDALLQDADAYVWGGLKQPGVLAEIGRRVSAQVQDLPEIAALAELTAFRGERLLVLNQERQEGLAMAAEELGQAISALSEGTRKLRCWSLLHYHVGIFAEACGRFDVAAELQGQSAEEAGRLKDRAGVAIARFCEAWNRFKDALVRAEEGTNFDAYFSALENAFGGLQSDLAGSSLQVQWAEANCPASMIEACVWLGKHPDVNKWGTWIQTTLAASKKLGAAFAPSAQLMRALDWAYLDDARAGEALADVASSEYTPEIRATAMLVLSRLAMRAGAREKAEKIIAKMPVEGTQHICAIARRLLDTK